MSLVSFPEDGLAVVSRMGILWAILDLRLMLPSSMSVLLNLLNPVCAVFGTDPRVVFTDGHVGMP